MHDVTLAGSEPGFRVSAVILDYANRNELFCSR